MLSGLWGKITGKDKRKKYCDQQAQSLGRTFDSSIIMPYGLYADLPNDALVRFIDDNVSIPVTVARPSDTDRGEPTFFHPETNTRIILRNNSDLDIFTGDGNINITTKEINISCTNVNLNSSGNVNATISGDVTADVGGGITATVDGEASLNVTGNSTITTPNLNVVGNLSVSANFSVTGTTTLGTTVTSGGKDISLNHKHSGSPTAPTGPISPTGVVT